jgi:hypothetical protein
MLVAGLMCNSLYNRIPVKVNLFYCPHFKHVADYYRFVVGISISMIYRSILEEVST